MAILVHGGAQSWLTIVVVLSVLGRSCSMVCLDGTEVLPNNGSSRRRDLATVVVKTYFNIDVEQIPESGEPDQRCKSSFRFAPHDVKIPQEVTRKLLIRERQQNYSESVIMINGALPITDYDPCRTKFEVVAGEWVLFSEPAFKGCTITINPHSRPMILFIVKSIKPNPARGIKQYLGEYFVSLMDFNLWMRKAYPDLPIKAANHPLFLNEMLWFDMAVQIFRNEEDGPGGLIRIDNDGGVFADHPFNEPDPFGQTTIFFNFEIPGFLPGAPTVNFFQSILNPFNFLGVRRNPLGELELVSDTSGGEESGFAVIELGVEGDNLLKSQLFCVFVAVDTTGDMPVFELLPDPPEPRDRGAFVII